MRLVMNGVKSSALVGLLGVSVWAIGCGETTSSPKANGNGQTASTPAKTNGEAGSGASLGGGVDVPEAKDSGTVDPAEFTKPADDAKPEGDAKPADSTEDKKTEGAAESK